MSNLMQQLKENTPEDKALKSKKMQPEWKKVKLGEIASFRTGPFGSALHKSDYIENGIPLINPMHIIDGQIVPSDSMTVPEHIAKKLNDFRLEAGEIIIGRRGDMGRCAVVKAENVGWLCGTGSMIVRGATKKVVPEYLQRVLSSPSVIASIEESSVGSTMINLNQGTLSNLDILLPSYAEQSKIAGALVDTDILIASLEKLIAKKRAIKTAAMQQLLTGKKRLPEFEQAWKAISIREGASLNARIGWQSLTTEEYLDQGDYFLVTGTDFKGGRVNWSTCHYVDKWRYSQDRNIQLKDGDVLLTKDGTIGKVGYVDNLQLPATLNSGVFVIRPIQNAFHPLYLFYVLSSKIFDEFLSRITAGSTITHLYQKDFVTFEFEVPQLDEQVEIASLLAAMDEDLDKLELRLHKTQELKKGMMQELLTGKTRLIANPA